MRTALLLGSLALAANCVAAEAARTGEPVVRKRRILYNSDGTNVFMFQEPLTAEDVRARVDEVAGTQVDTFLICPNAGMNLYYPGQAVPMIGEGRQVPPKYTASADEYRREARTLWADGVDGIYLFNFFCSREEEKPLQPPFFLLNELGDPKTLQP
jgi:hypothetical protein